MTGGAGADQFRFINYQAGGTDLILDFTSKDQVALIGYGKNAVANALKTQTVVGGSVTITLSDNTRITFAGVTSLNSNEFTTK